MKTPKGDKTAGIVTLDLAVALNKSKPSIESKYPLEKCPIEGSFVELLLAYESTSDNPFISDLPDDNPKKIESDKNLVSTFSVSGDF